MPNPYRIDPDLRLRIQGKNPERNCEHRLCPRRNSGYEGRKMKVCAKCHHVRYCSKECQKENWRVHKMICKKFEPIADYTGWMEKYDSLFRWAAKEAFRIHASDDIFHNILEITATYSDRVPAHLGTTPSPFYIITAKVLPLTSELSGVPVLIFADLERSLEIHSKGGIGRANLLFNFLENPFTATTKSVLRPYRIDFTDPPIPGYTHSIDWKSLLIGLVNGKISVTDISPRVDVESQPAEDVQDDLVNGLKEVTMS
ncbi:hypothetical protein BDP27DRAFT_1327471 [Rhodocollybia butyracea]|uniref:MYND-type domain-containing protein n=1 Tax=Rhodocollybia butyracea TaxID=206335 RepID=A0A9P5PQS7_9AGAR|nr:hypothetical protein BDP27DRAFT_1327471 [Rhodocollybia butyracea]